MGPAAVLVDGEPRGTIDATDRGLAYGDGVFRTLAVRAGRALNWRRHYARLSADCATLRLGVPAEPLLADEVRRVAPGEAVVKIVVTRGAGGRGYAIAPGAGQARLVMAFPRAAHPPERGERGVAVRRCQLRLAEQPAFAGAKTLNRLENVLARAEWADPDIAEGLLGDARGHVVGGTMSNVFVARGGRVATPDVSRCGVAGAQRARVLDILGAQGLECAVREVPWEELVAAEEVFLTNSLIGLWPVVAFEARRWSVGPVARRVRDAIEAEDARP